MERMNVTTMDMSNFTMHKMNMQMSFYWGSDVTILFRSWPGNYPPNTGMYLLALFFVFAMAFLMEASTFWPTIKLDGNSPVTTGLLQACVYVVQVGLGYLVMLAIISYNVGIFIAAVGGHTVGFFVARTSALACMPKASEIEPSAE